MSVAGMIVEFIQFELFLIALDCFYYGIIWKEK